MAPDWPKRLTDLVRAAAPLSERERSALLDRECVYDPELRRRVEAILTAQESATLGGRASIVRDDDSRLAEAAAFPGSVTLNSALVRPLPRSIGSYKVLGLLGEGGMGVVYLAQQDRPRRTVALKVVRPGYLSPSLLRRFESESDILARLQHPGIAQIHEAGTAQTELGAQPFFAMEYIEGESLTDFADHKELDVRHRLQLFAKICDAVQHAHTKGVIHRDLKPGNIVVTAQGEPKILDFGIARATDSDVQSATMNTDAGQLIGTIAYMSPEQLAGNARELDTRSDVYTLGVILYELLSGRLPHPVEGKTIAEAVRTIEESKPLPLGTVDRHFRGDLQTIVGKAMEKERDRRYQSAAELAADIGRFLRDEPILARPPSASYKISKFAKRNKGLVAGIAAAVVLLFGGIGATSWQATRATKGWEVAEERRVETAEALEWATKGWNVAEERRIETAAALESATKGWGVAEERRIDAANALETAKTERDNAQAVNEFLNNMFLSIDPDNALGREISVREVLDQAAAKIATSFKGRPRVEAAIRQTLGRTYHAIGRLKEAEEHHVASLKLFRETVGEDEDETIEAMRNLSGVLTDESKYDEADALAKEAVAIYERLRGHEHSDTGLAIGELGRVLQEQGRFDEARELIKESIRIGLATLGKLDPRVLVLMHNYGTALKDRGELPEAEKYLRDVLALRIEVYGEDHPQTAFTYNSLAATLQKLGRADEAAVMFEKTLAIRRKVLGEDHPSTITSMANLGVTYMTMKRPKDAEILLRGAYEASIRTLGEEHSKTLITMGSLAYVLEEVGKPEEAEAMYRRVIDVRRKAAGGRDPETWSPMNNLAMLLTSRGKPAEAALLYKELLTLCEKTLPPTHYYIAIYRNNYGECLTDLGNYAEAEEQLLGSLGMLETTFGKEHVRVVKAYTRLAKLYEKWGKPEKAKEYEGKGGTP